VSARDIDEVVSRLDGIVAATARNRDPAGLFAALYRQVTLRVRADCDAGRRFDDIERMRVFDTRFANRYFDAWDDWQAGHPERVTRSWQAAFAACRRRDLLLIQYVVLGVNAHINLDLAIAALETCEALDQPVSELAADFDRINDILTELLDPVQDVLNQQSLPMAAVDVFGTRGDELLGVFSLKLMRERAWAWAERLGAVHGAARHRLIREADLEVSALALRIADPPGFRWAQRLATLGERGHLDRVILALNAVAEAPPRRQSGCLGVITGLGRR
jgi:hypothetical protein